MFELTAGRDPGRLAHGEGLPPRCQGWAGAASASGRVGIRPDVVYVRAGGGFSTRGAP